MKIYASSDNTFLDKYIGKDLWVRVWRDFGGELWDCYIKILSREGDMITFVYLKSSIIDGRETDEDEIYWELTTDFENVKETWDIHDLNLYTPMDIITTEELRELIHPYYDKIII